MPRFLKKILKNPILQQSVPFILFALIYLTSAYRNFFLPEGTAYISGIEAIKHSSLVFFSLCLSVFLFILHPPQYRYTKIVIALSQIVFGILALLYLASGGQSETFFNFLAPFYKIFTLILYLIAILTVFNREVEKWQIVTITILGCVIASVPHCFV